MQASGLPKIVTKQEMILNNLRYQPSSLFTSHKSISQEIRMSLSKLTCLFAESSVETALRLVQWRFVAVRPMYLAPGFHLERLVEPVVHRDILKKEKALIRGEIFRCRLWPRGFLTGEEIKCPFILWLKNAF